MHDKIVKPDWARHIEMALNGLREGEKECAKITEAAYRRYSEDSYSLARQKYEGEMEL